jgi:hypothetical protein
VSGDYFIFVVGEISKWRWDNQTPEPGYGRYIIFVFVYLEKKNFII